MELQPTVFFQRRIEHSLAFVVWSFALLKIFVLASILIVASQANRALAANLATPPVECSGTSLLQQIKTDDPQAFAKIQMKADRTLNGNSRFWKIEKEGLPTSWLLGTMHFADPRVANLPGPVEKAFVGSTTVVIENTQILDEKEAALAMAKLRSLMFFTDGSTLEDRYGAATIELLKNRLKGREIPYYLGKRMQPWVLASAIVLPMCELDRKHRKQPVLDVLIGQRAIKEGKNLIGLETIEEQISAIAGLPLEYHLKSLEESVRLGSRIDDMTETMVQLYAEGAIGMFLPLAEYFSPESTSGPDYELFQQVLIFRRNATMAERSMPSLEKGGAFIAVGALHLPGEKGLVKLLQDAGFTVTAAL